MPISFRDEVKKILNIKTELENEKILDNDDENIDIKKLMEECLPGKDRDYNSYDGLEHDGGSLYDQYEYIRDNMD